MNENLREWVKDIGLALIIGMVLIQFIKPTIVKEHSMEPTLQENNYIFLSKQSYQMFGKPAYGDIIVFHSDLKTVDGKEKPLVKRIVGLPGDVIDLVDGIVYRNGEPIEEPYTKDGYTNGYMEEVTVPADELFVMGDNRQNSIDSRDPNVGCVPIDSIIGKAVFRVFPFNEIGLLK